MDLATLTERRLLEGAENYPEETKPTAASIVQGSDFPLLKAHTRVLASNLREVSSTHVVIRDGCLEPLQASRCSEHIKAGFRLRVVSIHGTQALVARDGHDLGLIALDLIAPLQ
jgi:hypothetical protein